MKNDYPCLLEEVKHSKQKEARIIDTLEPVMNQHRLVIDRKVIEWDYSSTKGLPPELAFKYQLFYQMSRITRDKGSLAHDDRLDCLSMAVAYWTETMAQDAEKRIEQRRDELMEKEMKAWERGAKSGLTKLSVLLGGDDGERNMEFSFRTYTAPYEKQKGSSSRRLGGLLR